MPKKTKATVAELEARVELLALRVAQLEVRVVDASFDASNDPAVPSEPLDPQALWRGVVDDTRHYAEASGYSLRGYL